MTTSKSGLTIAVEAIISDMTALLDRSVVIEGITDTNDHRELRDLGEALKFAAASFDKLFAEAAFQASLGKADRTVAGALVQEALAEQTGDEIAAAADRAERAAEEMMAEQDFGRRSRSHANPAALDARQLGVGHFH